MLNFQHVGTYGVTHRKWLSAISDLEIATIGGKTLLVAATEYRGAGVSSLAITAPDRPLKLVDKQAYLKNFTYQREPDVSLLELNGDSLVHLGHLGGAENLAIGLGPTGELDGFNPAFTGSGISAPVSAIGQFTSSEGSFLYVAHQDDLRIALHKIDTKGRLVKSDSITLGSTDAPPGSLLDEIIETQSGGKRYLVAISKSGEFISTHRVTDSGEITASGMHSVSMGAGYSVPTGLEAVLVAGQRYVIVASAGSSTLTVFRLLSDGRLKPTDHVLDEGLTAFQGVTALETATVDGRVFIFTGGVDDGISVFTLQPGGRLLHLKTLDDRDDMTLADVSDIEARVIDKKIALFVSSASETGITQLLFDPGRIGLTGPTSTDRASGTADNDLLIVRPGTSMIWGGDGDDILIATTSDVKMFGGAGADIFVPANTSGRNLIKGFEPGVDSLDLSQLGMIRSFYQIKFTPRKGGIKLVFEDVAIDIITSDGSTLTEADFSNDLFPITHYKAPKYDVSDIEAPLPPTTIARHIFGTNKSDRLTGTNGSDMIVARSGDDVVSGGIGNDKLYGDSGRDRLLGETGDDLLLGGAHRDMIKGGSGHDTGNGGSGNDILFGGTGHDFLNGSEGRDRLEGEKGNDKLVGGPGNDSLYGGSGADVLIGTEGANKLLGQSGNDRITGGKGRDLIDAGTGNDLVSGGSGNDRINGSDGNDFLRGRIGNDRISGGKGADKLMGDDHSDVLIGGSGNDIIRGGSSGDMLEGGTGFDWLHGGGGKDVFRFASFSASKPGRPDVISDFRPRWDDIDLSELDLNYIGSRSFSDARQLRWETKHEKTIVSADLDGNGAADMAIILDGRIRLAEDDFIF